MMTMCTRRRQSKSCYIIFILLITLVFSIYIILVYDTTSIIHPEVLNDWATVTIPIPNITLNSLNDTIFTQFKTVIGLGAAKCGSSSMKRLLQLSTPQYITKPLTKYKYRYIVHGETSYWLSCHRQIHVYIYHAYQNLTGCNFNEYYKRTLITPHLSHHLHKFEGQYHRLIFMEKTPSYLTHYQTPNILTHYANVYKNIYFYVLLRDPIKRLWSHYWMHYLKNTNSKLNPGKMRDIHKMEEDILRDLEGIKTNMPLFMHLLYLMQDRELAEISKNDILQLYEMSQRKEMSILGDWNTEFPCILKSCYYPQLLNWYNLMNNDELFQQRFRIIQTEWFVQNERQTMNELLCWINGGEEYEYDLNECEKNEGGIPKDWKMRKNHKSKDSKDKKNTKEMKEASWSPDIVNVLDLNVSNVLRPFFKDCNERLYDFIDQHPKIVLGNRPFVRFEDLS